MYVNLSLKHLISVRFWIAGVTPRYLVNYRFNTSAPGPYPKPCEAPDIPKHIITNMHKAGRACSFISLMQLPRNMTSKFIGSRWACQDNLKRDEQSVLPLVRPMRHLVLE